MQPTNQPHTQKWIKQLAKSVAIAYAVQAISLVLVFIYALLEASYGFYILDETAESMATLIMLVFATLPFFAVLACYFVFDIDALPGNIVRRTRARQLTAPIMPTIVGFIVALLLSYAGIGLVIGHEAIRRAAAPGIAAEVSRQQAAQREESAKRCSYSDDYAPYRSVILMRGAKTDQSDIQKKVDAIEAAESKCTSGEIDGKEQAALIAEPTEQIKQQALALLIQVPYDEMDDGERSILIVDRGYWRQRSIDPRNPDQN